jgi:uncharacterized protein (TIGR03086 family)
MEPLDVLKASRTEFRRRLSVIGPDQWDLSTPCDHWSVREVVEHVVRGNHMAVLLLHGTSREDTLAAMAEPVPEDLPGAFDDSADRQQAAFDEPGSVERLCHHPVGDIPGSQLLGFRTGDLALHAWDLARAIGADDTLDPDVVTAMWSAMSPMASFIGETGFFGAGPSGTVPDDAPLQQRVLDLSGRRP